MKSPFFFCFFCFVFYSCKSKEKKTEVANFAKIDPQAMNKYNQELKELKFTDQVMAQDTIDASTFNVKADYNGKKGTDNRKALQLAIDFCSKNSKVLRLPKGKILLNSYGITNAAKAHANILELKSNTNIVGDNSEIVLGEIFHDRAFVLLSGLNAVDTKDFINLNNIYIKNIIFNFNSKKVFMVSKYQLMRGIEMGHVINGEISGCTFKDGDITAAIITGQGNRSISKNVKIFNNSFSNLVKSKENTDHTTVYLNSKNSEVYKNNFRNTSDLGKTVACATELHNSGSSFHDNSISGYLRMNYVAAILSENPNITDIKIYNNRATLTSAAVYLWTEDNTRISNLSITNNKIFSSHVDGYSMYYNGTQGILADARVGENSIIKGLLVEKNETEILKTNISGRAVNFMFEKDRVFEDFKERNNVCRGCNDGKYYKSGFTWPF